MLWQGRPQQDWPVGAAATLRALMPQQAQDRFALTVERTLALSQVVGAGDGARVAELMSALDIAALAARRADQLSGGERQRVALAQCAMQGAALMLLDEPVSFQDPAHQQVVGRWLADAAAGAASARGSRARTTRAGSRRVATHVLALFGDGRWRAGPVDEILSAPVLERPTAARGAASRAPGFRSDASSKPRTLARPPSSSAVAAQPGTWARA